jgi:mono/diheme cytochrome c family protein
MRRWFALFALMSSGALAQSAGQWTSPEHIWRASCGYCHGTGVALELRGLKLPREVTIQTARRGAPGMPLFRNSEITDKELEMFASWLERTPIPRPASPGKATR